MNITAMVWIVSILFCFLIFLGLYNFGYLFGAHWFTVGFVAASAIFQYPFLSLSIVIAQLLPAITACIGTLIIFIREQKSYSNNRGNYEF